MTRRSMAKRSGLPTVTSRWTMPRQVKNDVEVTARALGINGGELAAIFCIRGLRALRERWNAEAMREDLIIPELPSMRLEARGWSIKDLMEELRS